MKNFYAGVNFLTQGLHRFKERRGHGLTPNDYSIYQNLSMLKTEDNSGRHVDDVDVRHIAQELR
jgi:hypothetical protein